MDNRCFYNNRIIRISPTDFYYNTPHEINIQKNENISVCSKPYCSRTYEINSKNDYRNKNLVSHSTIITNLINNNKNKY